MNLSLVIALAIIASTRIQEIKTSTTDNKCQLKGEFPHPSGDCTKFSSCSAAASERVDESCSDSTLFDPFIGKCVERSEARHCATCFDKTGERFKNPTDKNSYFECIVNFPKHHTCKTGMIFNNEEKRCTPDDSSPGPVPKSDTVNDNRKKRKTGLAKKVLKSLSRKGYGPDDSKESGGSAVIGEEEIQDADKRTFGW